MTCGFPHPWMLLLDSSGNKLRDTMYSDHDYPGCYLGSGNIFRDVNGGYFHWGAKDSTPTPYPQSPGYLGNFPTYVAHLDTNFKMQWRVSFPVFNYHNVTGVRVMLQVIQTKDSGYLAMGDVSSGYVNGWLYKLDKRGKTQWEHFYYKDSTQQGYLADAEERTNGGYVCVGWTKACPTCSQDVWLLSVDSNGCELPGCSNGLAVPGVPVAKAAFELYPNPTSGAFTVAASSEGVLNIYSLQGALVAHYAVINGRKEIQLPSSLAAGIYAGQYQSRDGKTLQTVRIIYQP